MAAFHLLPSPISLPSRLRRPFLSSPFPCIYRSLSFSKRPLKASNDVDPSPPKSSSTRRGRKKKTDDSPSTPESTTKKRSVSRNSKTRKGLVAEPETASANLDEIDEKSKIQKGSIDEPETKSTNYDELDEDYDDGIDFPYEYPPLVCCFGAGHKEFVPSIRVSEEQMDPDIYSQWKMLQWNPPEFVRAPGGPPSNVAISLVRLGGRAAFIGKFGDDEFGKEMLLLLNQEKVQTRGVKLDKNLQTGCSRMKVKLEDGKMKMEIVEESPEDSLFISEINLAVLQEARMFHFNSEILTSPQMSKTLFKAIYMSKKFGSLIFFDPNLPLPLWKSRVETRKIIKRAWEQADIIEVSRQELEFLIDEDYYEKKRNYVPQYFSQNWEQTKNRRDYYHYTKEELSPLWHDGLKLLLVTDGTLRIHFYTPSFDGAVIGTEDVLITPYTCDRTGSGDAVVAAIIRKLTTVPEMYEDQDVMERQLRFAVAAGIIAQWTIGAVRGFPTESATQNLKEQVYVPSLW